jgi:hypothetical protein
MSLFMGGKPSELLDGMLVMLGLPALAEAVGTLDIRCESGRWIAVSAVRPPAAAALAADLCPLT